MKRDPESYRSEFQQQYRHFVASLEVFKVRQQNSALADDASSSKAIGSSRANSKDSGRFSELVQFITGVLPSFKTTESATVAQFPELLLDLVSNHIESLEPHMRKTVVQSLIVLSNRDLAPRLRLLPVFFQLFRCADKELRRLVFQHIISDIRRVNKRTQNHKLNSSLQGFMFTMLRDENSTAAKKSLDVMIELWRRRIWRDEKTVNAIAQACFSQHSALVVAALHFFLGTEDIIDDPDLEMNPHIAAKDLHIRSMTIKHVKHSKRKTKQRAVERESAKIKKAALKQNVLSGSIDEEDDERAAAIKLAHLHSSIGSNLNLPAIQLVYDPQTFAERLFSRLRASSEAFETRLLLMNVISRLVGGHQLLLFNFYPFLQKYVQPYQRKVTLILTYLAQAAHDMVPPEVIEPCVRTLANHFVTDRSSPEVMAVGLNAIREVCARCPLSMTRELLQDIVQYKKSKQKGVMMAARSLIALFRQAAPELLHRRDRGKEAAMGVADGSLAQREYGASTLETDVPGAQLLLEPAANDSDSDEDDDDDEEEVEEEVEEEDESAEDAGDDAAEAVEAEEEEEEQGGAVEAVESGKGKGSAKGKGKIQLHPDQDDLFSKKKKQQPLLTLLGGAGLAAERGARVEGGDGDDATSKHNPAGQDAAADDDDNDNEDENDDDEEEAEANEEQVEDEEAAADDDDDEDAEVDDDEDDEEQQEVEEDDDEAADDDEAEDDEAGEEAAEPEQPRASKRRKQVSASGEVKSAPMPSPPPGVPLAATRVSRRLSMHCIDGGEFLQFFTDEDFKRIRKLQEKKQRHKRGKEDGSTLTQDLGDQATHRRRHRRQCHRRALQVEEETIVGYVKPSKRSREERMETVREGREGRDAFGRPKEKPGGTTNEEKRRNKPFLLTKHSLAVRVKTAEKATNKLRARAVHIKTLKRQARQKNKNRRRI